MAGGGDELKLLGMWASPFVLRARLALSFKGLSYEYVEEEIFGDKSELLLKSNPVHKKVPVLIHNGKPICESQVIVEYIDEVFSGTGPSLLPADPYERAIARFWAAYIDDKLFGAFMVMIRGKTSEEKAEGRKQCFAVAETLEGALKECSKQGKKPFFGGDNVGYIDEVFAGTGGPSLLPADPYERAVARFWTAYIDDKFFGAFMVMIKGKTSEEKAEGRKQSIAAAETLEGALKELSKQGKKPFFGGDNVGYIDVALGGFVAWVRARDIMSESKQFDASRTPLLAAWLERFCALDATRAVMPDVEKLVELSRMRQAREDAAAAAKVLQSN